MEKLGVGPEPGNNQTSRQGIVVELCVAMTLPNRSMKIPAEQTAAEIISVLVKKVPPTFSSTTCPIPLRSAFLNDEPHSQVGAVNTGGNEKWISPK